MIDSHAHILSEYFEDIELLVNELKSKNVLKVINCATGFNDINEILELSKKYNDFLYPAIGIHPENINDLKFKPYLKVLIENCKNEANPVKKLTKDYKKEVKRINK